MYPYELDEWDEYFLKIADTVSSRATCPRLSVGAVIVKNRNILATGYNGSASGFPHCDEEDYQCKIVKGHCVRTVHAETNAILQAAKNGASIDGAKCYVTHSPCLNCFKNLINAGIVEIVWSKRYKDGIDDHIELLSDASFDNWTVYDNRAKITERNF